VKRQKKRRPKRAKAEANAGALETPRAGEPAPPMPPPAESKVEAPRPSFPRASVYVFAACLGLSIVLAGVLEWILS
jgi:hypothetical protein